MCLAFAVAVAPRSGGAQVPLDEAGPSIYPPCSRLDPGVEPAERSRLAREEIATADARFKDGEAKEALRAIDRAECHEDNAEYDFMRAKIHDSLGDCDAAREHMQRFLAAKPPALAADAAREVVLRCEQPQPPVPAPEPTPQTRFDPPIPADQLDGSSARPGKAQWWRDPWGGGLLGLGGVTLATGIGLAAGAASLEREPGFTYAEFEAQERRRKGMLAGAGTMFGVAGASFIGAIVRYVIVARRGGERSVPRHARAGWRAG